MNSLKLVLTVFCKETKDGMRDSRSILCVAFSAVITPLLLMWMFTFAGAGNRQFTIELPIVGAEFVPDFVNWLKQQDGVQVLPGPSDPARAVRDWRADVVLVISNDSAQNMARGTPSVVRLISDGSSRSSQSKADVVRTLVRAYSAILTRSRLIARGVDPLLLAPLQVEEVNASGAQDLLSSLLTILPVMLVVVGLTGGMMIAIDATAGERERASLEPLLLSPVKRGILVAGKWLAASAFSSVAVGVAVVLILFLVRRVSWHEMSIRFPLSDLDLIRLLFLILPLTLLMNALMILASTFARSFREAQGYMAVVIALPSVPGLFSMSESFLKASWFAPVPILGQFSLAAEILNGKPPSVPLYVLGIVSPLLCTFVVLVFTASMLKRESIIFGR